MYSFCFVEEEEAKQNKFSVRDLREVPKVTKGQTRDISVRVFLPCSFNICCETLYVTPDLKELD